MAPNSFSPYPARHPCDPKLFGTSSIETWSMAGIEWQHMSNLVTYHAPSVICHRSCVHKSLYQCILSIISIITAHHSISHLRINSKHHIPHSGWVFCAFLRCNSRSSTLQSWMCLLGNHQIPANQRHNAKHLPCEVAFKTFPAAFPGALEVK